MWYIYSTYIYICSIYIYIYIYIGFFIEENGMRVFFANYTSENIAIASTKSSNSKLV